MNEKQPIPERESRTPWSSGNRSSFVTVKPVHQGVEGTIRLPGSKSLTNRALLIAALAEGTSRIEGILKSDDSYWCIDSLTKLGVKVELEGHTARVEGCGGEWPVRHGELFVGAAGTVARFIPAALAVSQGVWSLSGSKRMSERPLAPLLDALSSLGARLSDRGAPRCLPFTLEANGLTGGEAMLPGSASSQFISGLLLAAPYAKEPLRVTMDGEVVQREYVDMTIDMMRRFDVHPQITNDSRSILVPTGRYQATTIRLEPDVSTCCYFWAAAALTGGRIRTEGVDAETTRQPDIEMLNVLERMGCTVRRGKGFVEVEGVKRIKGGFTLSMKAWSDQTLTVAAMAPFADGPITLTGAAHIRHHECDRLSAICSELRKLGIRVDEREDGLTVYPGRPIPAPLDTYDDHRMAMALSLIALNAEEEGIRIKDPGCVSKTCPDYFERLAGLGIPLEYSSPIPG